MASHSASALIPSGSFAPYVGTGVGSLVVALNAGTGTYAGAAHAYVLFGGRASAAGEVVISYDYNAVPEPSTYIAGLGALCLFGFTAIPKRKVS